MSEKTLITGGAGFIGSALRRHLVATGRYRLANVHTPTCSGDVGSLSTTDRGSANAVRQAAICQGEAMLTNRPIDGPAAHVGDHLGATS